MKILAISHSCVVDVNQQLYVALAQLGAEVELVVPARWSDAYSHHKKPEILPAVDFPLHRLPVWKPGHLMLHFYRGGLAKVLSRCGPDLVFIDEEPGSLVAAQASAMCARRNIPFALYTKQNILKRYPPPFGLIEKRMYRTARAIVALSPEVREVLRAKGFSGAVPLLAHGCDLALFREEKNPELRARLGLKSFTFGYLGRIVPEKGLETLVEAAGILRDKGCDFTVLLVGSGAQETELRAQISGLKLENHFHWTGAVPHHEAGDYLRCMDCFVLPSRTQTNWKEQFGRVVIEAMACGVPVVGSDSGYIPDLLRETGGGLTFREGEASDCARALEILLWDEKKRAELGQIGARAVRANFTYEAIGARLLEILRELMGSE